jgi:hypothetical protein
LRPRPDAANGGEITAIMTQAALIWRDWEVPALNAVGLARI